jgi:D-alanine-D-alanine ligase
VEKLTVAVLFGGMSGEHEVSLRSAESIMAAMDREKYRVIPIGISKAGEWRAGAGVWSSLKAGKPEGNRVALLPETTSGELLYLEEDRVTGRVKLDAVFPVLHGPYGEDGTIQGLLDLAGLPYVGSGVLGSAVGMDKVIMKMVLQNSGLPVGDYLFFTRMDFAENPQYWLRAVEDKCGYPCFVKPANLGSSVGITKAKNREGLVAAIREAARYDVKVLVEKALTGKEVECSVLGNYHPRASAVGEIIPCNEFYDYRAKYIDDRSELIIPAPLSPAMTQRVRSLAVKTFRALNCFGLGRVDFFANPATEDIYINEINTIPGFTSISMYPKLWEASGLKYAGLVDELIKLALKRHQIKSTLLTSYQEA